MSKNFDICIRGDGVVGRTLALLLAQQRLRVALVGSAAAGNTASSKPGGDVRAYALNQASRQLLEQLRAWPSAESTESTEPAEPGSAQAAHAGVTPVLEMQIWGDDGGALGFSAHAAGQPALAWIVEVPALLQRLGEALRFQPQIEWLPAGDVSAPVKAALTVYCEGQAAPAAGLSASSVGAASRQARFSAQWYFAPYPQKAIAAQLTVARPHEGIARQWFMPSGEVLALLPIGGLAGQKLALVWSVVQEKAESLERMDSNAFCAALQEACTQAMSSTRPAEALTSTADGADVFDVLAAVQLCSPRASWPLTLSTAQSWVGPGWALAGDAAHTVHPLAGQGLNLGLADAACLAKVLAAREYWRPLGDEKLLRRYERARNADVAAVGLVTDGLQSIFGPTGGPLQVARNWGMNGFEKSGFIKRWAMQKAAGL